jgi:hypothetical protein
LRHIVVLCAKARFVVVVVVVVILVHQANTHLIQLLYRASPESADERHYLFLFNDLLLIARPSMRAVNAQHPLVLLLDLAKVSDVLAPQDSDFVRHCLLIDTPRRSLMLLARDDGERDAWLEALLGVVRALRVARSSRRRTQAAVASSSTTTTTTTNDCDDVDEKAGDHEDNAV